MDLKAFYDALRPTLNLTQQNVLGADKVVAYGMQRGSRLNDLAYILATAWWESGQTMHPVAEAYYLGSRAESYRKKLRYYPWYGRGLVQTTWQENYEKVALLIGLPKDTFTKTPDALLEWEYALPALFVGMERGIYTGKKLSDYIDDLDEDDNEDLREFANARRIVNGTDKQIEIAKIALAFKKALKRAGYVPGGQIDVPVPEEPEEVETPPVTPLPPESKPEEPSTPETPIATGTGGLSALWAAFAGVDPWLCLLIGVAASITLLIVFRALKD